MDKYNELVNSKIYKGITANVCKNHPLKEDLHCEAILVIVEKGYDLNANTNLQKFFAAIVWLTWRSNKFQKKYTSVKTDVVELDELELIDMDKQIEYNCIGQQLDSNYSNEIEYYEKELLRLYVKLGDCKAIAKQTNIPYRTVANDIKIIKDKLRIAHNEENSN
jgi:hypothetical protein